MFTKTHKLILSSTLYSLILWILVCSMGCSPSIANIDPDLFEDPPTNTITFWGHSSCYIDVDGYGIVTDPVFEKRVFVRWRKIPAPHPSTYQNTRVILISHAHGDHLSPKTLETFPKSAIVLCPAPAMRHLSDLDMTVKVMEPGDKFEIPGGRIIVVAAHHPGGRFSLDAEADGHALGYVIKTPVSTVFYAGDTDFFSGFEEVGLKYRPNISLLNINGHLHSTDAVRAAWALRSETIIPLHYGAYGYLMFTNPKEPRDLEELTKLLGPLLHPLEVGGSIPLDGPGQNDRQ